ncbi:MAG: NAD(P)-dependent oxidoreductase [Rhodospirillales bacterium]|nr:NAD(P)-dependent oxidoreductase [Rhodospirillales bacterium]
MPQTAIGFIGLGNMGRPIAGNLVKSGQDTIVYDAAGTAVRAPQGAQIAHSTTALAGMVDVIHLCVPDGRASEAIARDIRSATDRQTRLVVDHSTIGTEAAQRVHGLLAGAGIEYVDAPVSGGVSGAVNATLAIMYSGSEDTFDQLQPTFEAMAGNVFRVGGEPGQGQAMKVLNNFLSGTAMAATAEAVAFGVKQGLEMGMILDVVNASSGRNTATADKFPNRVMTGSYDAGFSSAQFVKDLRLYRDAAGAIGASCPISPAVSAIWRSLDADEPNADITRIYTFVHPEDGD